MRPKFALRTFNDGPALDPGPPPAGVRLDHGPPSDGSIAELRNSVRSIEPQNRAGVNLTKLESELARNRLDEIATLVRSLTYGEMMELAQGFYKAKGEGEITGETLPGVIHRWSGTRE